MQHAPSGRLDGLWSSRGTPYVAIAAAALVAFLPGLGVGFVSDDYNFLAIVSTASLTDVLAHFVPRADSYYRPLSESLIFWLEYRGFGLQAPLYHVVALASHIVSALLLYRLILRIGVRTAASLGGTAVFVLSIHAHELVFWWGDDHYAFAGPAIVAAVLTYVEGRVGLSLALTVVALLSDEAGILVVPIVATYEAIFRWRASLPTVRSAVIRLTPVATVSLAYLALRIVGGGFWSESRVCRTPDCAALGTVEYFDRLFVRPGRLIELLRLPSAAQRTALTVAILAALIAMALLLRAWRWRDWRVIAFGVAWCAICVALFIYGLWPYVSDRFLYYPELGLAIAVAGAVQNALAGWTSASRDARLTIAGGLAVLTAWLAAGVPTIWHRAAQWQAASATVSAIFDQTYRLEPHPPSGAVLVFLDVPDSLEPDIPPGNTGPYVLRNGLTTGIRMRYGRADISPIPATAPLPPVSGPIACRRIEGSEVLATACPEWLTSKPGAPAS